MLQLLSLSLLLVVFRYPATAAHNQCCRPFKCSAHSDSTTFIAPCCVRARRPSSDVSSRVSTYRQSNYTTQRKRILMAIDKHEREDSAASVFYNDDAFGLIFLNSAFILQDVVFAAIFLLLSAVASVLVANGYNSKVLPLQSTPVRSIIPGVVAFTALAFACLLEKSWSGEGLAIFTVQDMSVRTRLVEVTFCTVSLLWGVWQTRKNQPE